MSHVYPRLTNSHYCAVRSAEDVASGSFRDSLNEIIQEFVHSYAKTNSSQMEWLQKMLHGPEKDDHEGKYMKANPTQED